ncbi:serine hydrolase [Rossellomorea aquimaris]|uniref:serine hydrolase n=1 Tax=Rossellomorea aquimaris TaxID=189382 RepID=UPI0011E91B48|nr:serine hydrolase [Rossellomorea aquimaris]TYS83514.1 serine hydrolase [Rossellomorea aquimaris]
MQLREEILRLIPRNVKLSFLFYDTGSKQKVSINEDEMLPLASITKLITAAFVLQKHTRYNQEDIFSCISKHSNEAYSNLLSEITTSEINSMLSSLNIDIRITKDNRDREKNIGSAKGIYDFLSNILSSKDLSTEKKQLILHSLNNQSDLDGFRLFESGNWAHMTGGMNGVCNDVGILELQNNRIFVIGLIKTDDLSIEWEHLENLLQKVGKLITKEYLN